MPTRRQVSSNIQTTHWNIRTPTASHTSVCLFDLILYDFYEKAGYYMTRNFLLVGAVVVVLSACAAPSTKLQNASGQVVDCSSSGFGVIGTAAALSMHSDCVKRMQAAGYRAVNETSVAPKPSADAAKVDIKLAEGWDRKPLTEDMANSGGSVYATKNKATETGFLLSVASRAGVTDLMAYAMSRRANLENKLLNPQSTEITRLDINARQAFRFEVSGYLKGGLKITYLYTIIEGVEQLAVVNAWAKSIDYPHNKEVFEGLASKLTGLS